MNYWYKEEYEDYTRFGSSSVRDSYFIRKDFIGKGDEDGTHRSGHEPSDEHAETTTRPVEQLQSEVPPTPRRMGETTARWPNESIITNDAWVITLNRSSASHSSGESTT
jgi:hypothetical protein